MYYAAYYGKEEAINLSLQYGADDYNSGLIGSCMYGFIDGVALMLYMGATNIGKALDVAKICGHADIVELLNTQIN